jgi:hypothetical protein
MQPWVHYVPVNLDYSDLYDSVAYVSVMRPPPSSLLDPVFLTYTLLHGGLETQTTFAKSSSKRTTTARGRLQRRAERGR